MRRFKRRSFRRGRRRPTQWVCAAGAYGSLQAEITGAAPLIQELVGATGTSAQFDPPVIQRFTVERVQGDIAVSQIGQALDPIGSTLHCGIIVVRSSAFPNVPLPGSVSFGGAEWLWLKHYTVLNSLQSGVETGNYPTFEVPHGPVVITRSKRVLREDEQLLFIAQVQNLTPLAPFEKDHWSVVLNLRTLISRVA